MMIIPLFLLLNRVSSIGTSECYDFMCDPDYPDTSDNCVIADHNSSQIIFKTCPNLYVCNDTLSDYSKDEHDWTNKSCILRKLTSYECLGDNSRTTGYPCCYDNDCVSDKCINSMCLGKNDGESCKTNDECVGSASCISKNEESEEKYCLTSETEGGDCVTDTDCTTGLGCNYGTCKRLFSLDIGEQSEHNKFCQSYFRNNNTCDQVILMLNGYRLYSPFSCFVGDVVEYRLLSNMSEIYDTEDCGCGGVRD